MMICLNGGKINQSHRGMVAQLVVAPQTGPALPDAAFLQCPPDNSAPPTLARSKAAGGLKPVGLGDEIRQVRHIVFGAIAARGHRQRKGVLHGAGHRSRDR